MTPIEIESAIELSYINSNNTPPKGWDLEGHKSIYIPILGAINNYLPIESLSITNQLYKCDGSLLKNITLISFKGGITAVQRRHLDNTIIGMMKNVYRDLISEYVFLEDMLIIKFGY